MKKNYLKPEMDVVEIKFESDLMAGSSTHIGTGDGDGKLPEDGSFGESKPHNPSDNESIWD